ncbi:TPA: OprD family outer membrane porin [Pseudomonas aeruginosa]|nr:OprD family outer membrane porin [Pseudomonas aeruginosa]
MPIRRRSPEKDGRGGRDTDLSYAIQSGALKSVNVLWRNAALRSNYQRDIDENRLIISYTLPLF